MVTDCGHFSARMLQTRYIASLTVVSSLLYFVFLFRGHYDPNPTFIMFMHFISFAGHFGAQCWVTFIAGLTMFYNLPRFYFGQVQARLFPLYFFSTFLLSCVTFVTYAIYKPYHTWTYSDSRQVILLLICVISTFINAFCLATEVANTMVALFELEKKQGTAFVVGHVDRNELKRNPDYKKCYQKFRRFHALSGIANVTTLVCNVVYLYHLACMLHLNDKHCEATVS